MKLRAEVLLISAALFSTAISECIADPGTESTREDDLSFELSGIDFIVYGRIDRGVLVYDDGVTTGGYFPVDNDSLTSKLGLRFFTSIDDALTLGGRFELSLKPNSTEYVNQIYRTSFRWDELEVRRAELHLERDGFGKLWIGQGSMSSDGSSEVDLSGTEMIGYASVGDIANAQIFRNADGSYSDLEIGDAFDDLDGAERKLRIRYDTPQFHGFTLSTSVGTQIIPEREDGVVFDAVIRYEGTVADFSLAGALAYSQWSSYDSRIVNGSFSTLHEPTGLNLTVAGGTDLTGNADEFFAYGKLGYQRRYFDWGKSAFSVDFYYGNDISTDESESYSWGIQAVQDVDAWQTQIYVGARSYVYDDNEGSYRNGLAVMAGTLIHF